MPTYLPGRLLDQAEQRDFAAGLEPYMLDLQKQVTAGIGNLGAIVTGLSDSFTQGVESARRNLLPEPEAMPSPGPALGMGQDLSTPGYLSSAVPAPTPIPALGMGQDLSLGGSQTGQAPVNPPASGPEPPAAAAPSGFTLPSFEQLTGAASASPAQQQAGPAPAARPAADPFALPSWEQLTGLPETIRAAAAPVAARAREGASDAVAARSGPRPATTGAPGAPAPTGEIDNSSRASFVATAWPHMLAAAGGNRDAAEMMLAAAISENGSIGTGKPFWANNFFGIKGKGDAGSVNAATHEIVAGGRQDITDAFAAYSSPTAGFAAFFDFLKTNPRYGPAMTRYQQSGDAGQLFRDVNAAGYATDPQWASKVENIRAGQVAPVTRGLPDARAATAQPAAAPPVGTYAKDALVPNQFTEGQQQGLTSAEAVAVCGPAAAVAFARANGRNPTLREAKELASSLGLWDQDVGMHGPASQVQLLQKMGVPSRLEQGTDWGRVAAEVQQGRPVIVDTPQHYYVVNGYDPQTGEFEFGASAGVLRASGGKTRWRPAELPSLGMGAPRATIFMGAGP